MKLFKDGKGREWSLDVNVTTLLQVKNLAGINLLEVLDSDLLERLGRDPILLCNVLYAICHDQADERGISDEDFGRGLAGDTLAAATDALIEGLVDFFPRAQTRESLRLILKKANAATKAMDGLVRTKIESVTPESIVESLLATAGGSSGSVPVSPASIHDH